MISLKQRTLNILDKYNLNAKKRLGQNFLIDSSVVSKIVKEAGLDKDTGVIEIGPGIGSLTLELASNAKKVLCYEIDEDMIKILNENINVDNLKIIEKDFLKADIQNDLSYFGDCKEIKVVSNLPYYITTPIVFKLLESDVDVNDFYFMVQKEVGERFSGKVKTKDYNSLSVAIGFQADAKILFNVNRSSFYPAPNVDSVIINVKKIDKGYDVKDKKDFLRFVQNIFAMRRKTLVNNINNSYKISKDEIINILKSLNHKENVRSEELSVSEIVDLYNEIRGNSND